jgi:IrrE N-terminal-like domain
MKQKSSTHGTFWTNSSVLLLAGDPIQAISKRASELVLKAFEHGWSGPPFDPAKLAEHLHLKLVPNDNVTDARTVPTGDNRRQIEFNPNKPKARIRFSIAHEVAHTLFPDCDEAIRNRHSCVSGDSDDWQLEMLCNLAAAELLMPVGSFPALKEEPITIESVLELRKLYEVSTEAVALRLVRLTETPSAVFVASPREHGADAGKYLLDYAVASRTWKPPLQSGAVLPSGTILAGCTAIGFTTKGEETWHPAGPLHIEAVGVPPFPGGKFPRVVGILQPASYVPSAAAKVRFLQGDATQPQGNGLRVVAHIVNDKTPNWGVGFGKAVRDAWPEVQSAFRKWALSSSDLLRLGNVYHTQVTNNTTFFQMICQHGYGPSPKPRLRYAALKECLDQLAAFSVREKATVHMPRIGAGQGGGAWALIQQLIDEALCARGIDVTVYDVPGSHPPTATREPTLFDATRRI